ncbi:MAG TPA: hypothetical protein VFO55_03075 [Gemmatimonadaceae bacterium]|nr:hypothetical protein [Gemmatimonadaceae bacterium]
MRLRAILASVAVTLLAACGDATGPTSPVAAYALSSVDTKALPVVMYAEEGYSLEVTAGEMTLTADGKYTASMRVVETVDGNKSTYVDTESGTWTQADGGAITLKPTGAAEYSATWSGKTLTVPVFEQTFVYTMKDG